LWRRHTLQGDLLAESLQGLHRPRPMVGLLTGLEVIVRCTGPSARVRGQAASAVTCPKPGPRASGDRVHRQSRLRASAGCWRRTDL